MQGFEWVTCKRKRVNKDMKLYNRTANYSKMLLYHLLNLVKNHNTQYNVGRCIN